MDKVSSLASAEQELEMLDIESPNSPKGTLSKVAHVLVICKLLLMVE